MSFVLILIKYSYIIFILNIYKEIYLILIKDHWNYFFLLPNNNVLLTWASLACDIFFENFLGSKFELEAEFKLFLFNPLNLFDLYYV